MTVRFAFLLWLGLAALAPVHAGAAQVETAPPQAAPRTVTLAVENMTCRLCPVTVRKALEAVPGVISAEVYYNTKTAVVTFDPGRTGVAALTEATAKAGYPSRLQEE